MALSLPGSPLSEVPGKIEFQVATKVDQCALGSRPIPINKAGEFESASCGFETVRIDSRPTQRRSKSMIAGLNRKISGSPVDLRCRPTNKSLLYKCECHGWTWIWTVLIDQEGIDDEFQCYDCGCWKKLARIWIKQIWWTYLSSLEF